MFLSYFKQRWQWTLSEYRGGSRVNAPDLKLEKIWFFGVKSWFFTRNTSKIFTPPSVIGKIWFFGIKSWFFTRNTPIILAPPSARHNFFKCAPLSLTWNPGSAPGICYLKWTSWNNISFFLYVCIMASI